MDGMLTGTQFDLCPFTRSVERTFDEVLIPFGFERAAAFECTSGGIGGEYVKLSSGGEQVVQVSATTYHRADVDHLAVHLYLGNRKFGVALHELVLRKAPERKSDYVEPFREYYRRHVGNELPIQAEKAAHEWVAYVLLGPDRVETQAKRAADDLATYARSFLAGDVDEFRLVRRDVCRGQQEYWKSVLRTLSAIRRNHPDKWLSSDDAQLEAYEEWHKMAEL
jgi:hypothetical protein